jgi:hypothetical protein
MMCLLILTGGGLAQAEEVETFKTLHVPGFDSWRNSAGNWLAGEPNTTVKNQYFGIYLPYANYKDIKIIDVEPFDFDNMDDSTLKELFDSAMWKNSMYTSYWVWSLMLAWKKQWRKWMQEL